MNEETKDPKQQAAEMSADKAEAAKATEAEEKNAEPADGTPDPKDHAPRPVWKKTMMPSPS